ncbi:MAG TPA: hypothetical protein VF103_06840 [Polyangiaceae bacterium]
MPRPPLFPLLLVAIATVARGEIGHVPPPRPEIDAGPPPLLRAPEHARKPFALVPEVSLSLPLCEGGPGAEPCAALGPAFGGSLTALYRIYPYFAFGARASYFRSKGSVRDASALGGEVFDGAAAGRVYFYEAGAFDPYLELDLGYASLDTSFADASGKRYELSAFGPTARVSGGLDFVVAESFELGGSFAFSHLLLAKGHRCDTTQCDNGSAPYGAAVGALTLSLHATLTLGDAL